MRDSRIERIKRGGLILYTNVDDEGVFFCMGIDRNSSDLSDFGGQREEQDPTILHTAVREFNEESRRMIGTTLTVADIQDCKCIYNRQMILIFLEIGSGDKSIIHSINDSFTDMRYIIKPQSCKKNTSLEMRGLCWISHSDIKHLIANKNSPGVPFQDIHSVIFSPHSSVYYIRIYDVIADFWHASYSAASSSCPSCTRTSGNSTTSPCLPICGSSTEKVSGREGKISPAR